MFQVKIMTASDFQFAVQIANTMNWNMTTEDFKFNSSLEPEGCFVLFNNSQRVGIATSISFAKLGWFGNLIVREAFQRQGAGSLLVKHALNYLHKKGVETVGLYAYKHLINFYGKFGFKADQEFLYMQGIGSVVKPKKQLARAEAKELPILIKFDSDCFGASREKLLERIFQKSNLFYIMRENHEIIGYVVAKTYGEMAEVGPLMCQPNHPDTAIDLLRVVLAQLNVMDVYVCLPKQETKLVNVLHKNGFSEQFAVSRMFLGSPPLKGCISIAESLERG